MEMLKGQLDVQINEINQLRDQKVAAAIEL